LEILDGLRFRVLGPLAVVRASGQPLLLGTPKQRTVLALLILRGNHLVTVEELVDEVWPKDPPASAVANVRTYAANLRRTLSDGDTGSSRFSSRGPGYLLAVADDELDLSRFEHAVRLGRAALAAGDHAVAAGHLRSALGLWRGHPLADVPLGPVLSATCLALEEQRTAAVEAHAEARLGMGDGAAVLAMLHDHVRARPLRERGYELLMAARYQTGDVAGSLATYADARATLVDQLGVEPGPRLRRMQGAVLRGDFGGIGVAVGAQPGPTGPARRDPPVPRELPADLSSFTGRQVELARLRAALATGTPHPGRPTVICVYGPGGAGKSTLAVHFAHSVADRFPDGQIYLDLRGATAGLAPRTPYEALVGCLRSLGVPSERIPADPADAAARLRSSTAGRRLLLLLDNAVDAEQVAPLLPAGHTCAVLVTSRQVPATLDADLHLRVGGLTPADSVALLRRLAGPAHEPDAGRVASFCDHLPLALRIAGARLAARTDLTAADLAGRLSDERRRLDELGIGSLAVRSSLRISYDALTGDPVAVAAFRLLGIVRVPDVEPGTIAAALRIPDREVVRRALDRLVDAQLVEALPSGRYHLHDLVRLAAAEYAERDEAEPARRQALRRTVLYYLASARRADDLLRPGRRRRSTSLLPPDDLRPAPLATPADAVAWLDAEMRTLLAVAEQTSELPGEEGLFALRLAEFVNFTVGKRGEFHTELRFAELALRAATRHAGPVDSAVAKASAHSLVGRALLHLGRLDEATGALGRSLEIRRELGDGAGVAGTLMDLALVQQFAQAHEAAAASLVECLATARATGLRLETAVILGNLGNTYTELGRWTDARECFEESLALRRELGDRSGAALTLVSLAQVHMYQGDLDAARAGLDEAVTACRDSGNRVDEWVALVLRSEVGLRLGRVPAATEDAYAAATLAAVGDDPYPRAASLRQLAKVLRAAGAEADAVDFARHAGALFEAGVVVRSPAVERLLTDG